MEASELRAMGFPLTEEGPVQLKRGTGCVKCRGTGYYGRCGIFELFPMTDAIRYQLSKLEPETEIRKTAMKEGMTTLREDAWRKVRQGLTTIEEVLRVTAAD
jgi:general secretion pathway protein E